MPLLVADIASGRVEDSSSSSQKICLQSKFFVKKKTNTMLPQAILPFTG